MIQILINIIISFAVFILIALSFLIIYAPTKFFHFAHAAIITFAAYFTFLFSQQLGLSLWLSIPLSIIGTTAIGVLCEIGLYKPLRKRNVNPLVFLITSLVSYFIFSCIIWQEFSNSEQVLIPFL